MVEPIEMIESTGAAGVTGPVGACEPVMTRR
jgi:hypothetical protein